MKKKYGLKPILASLLVTASLVTPAVVLSSEALPDMEAELIFRGARLEYKVVDGETTVQAVFDVAVDKVVNGTGASFYLDYNPDYLTPSDMQTNRPVDSGNHADFFSADPDLFRDGNGNSAFPFETTVRDLQTNKDSFYSTVDTAPDQHYIHMALHLDQKKDGVIGSKIHDTQNGENTDDAVVVFKDVTYDETAESYVFNPWVPLDYDECAHGRFPEWPDKITKEVVLGQLSFQVNIERLPEIVKYFGSLDVLSDHRENNPQRPRVDIELLDGSKGGTTYLLDIVSETKVPEDKDPWQVLGYGRGKTDTSNTTQHPHPHLFQMGEMYYAPDRTDSKTKNVADHYIFSFPKDVIIKVEATNPEIVINAYQNYTDATTGDLPISLGKYSPMVTVTYADGSKENLPFPWGRADDGYEAYHVTHYTQADVDAWLTAHPGNTAEDCPFVAGDLNLDDLVPVTAANYDPTHGEYIFYQYYKYEDENGFTQTVDKPVRAHMTVTPITVIDVTADDLERTYSLGRVTSQVTDVNDLALPDQARIITDIVPAGVSLVTPIDGWMPKDETVSTWPDPAAALHSLKADSYTAASGVPYWPEATDTNLQAADHVGTYSFKTSNRDHDRAQGVQSAVIRATFPWLTVPDQRIAANRPEDDWPIDNAKRHIVANEDYADAANYTVSYVSTVTASGGGNGDGQPTLTLSVRRTDKDIDANSVFRIWLPNGQEIGTGQDRGGVKVDDWFGGLTFADHTHGFYDPGQRELDSEGRFRFDLDINPDDPTAPANAANAERETLRRYINLGGWYKVAICENPDHTTPAWTDPIPVYVPPRRNEYTESKVYNFIGENAALFNWPGQIGNTLYLPQGSYTPVGPLDTATGVGLPLYDNAGVITDGKGDPSIFEDGNPFRPLLPRYEESYGVSTVYDGQTGAQPGTIFSVRVDQLDTTHSDPWTRRADGTTHTFVGGDPVYRYGPTPLYTGPRDASNNRIDSGYQVMAFGYVHQPEADLTTYKATLRTQLEEKEPQIEKIKLVSSSPTGITRVVQDDYDSNVTLVTYDTKMEGYTVRQDYTLTIKNVGDVDIYGLNIDGLTDGYDLEPTGGRFEMLQPPASFLPAGGSTTFTLTYVYDLRSAPGDKPFNYRDTLYITSTSHPNAVHGGTNQENQAADGSYDYLLDFDAQFTVSKDPLHKVTVIYKPTNGTMGTAGLIVGEQGIAPNTVMNYTTTTQTFPKDDKVYVVVNLVDEYAVKSITIDDGAGNTIVYNGNPLTIAPYTGSATLREDTLIYVFDMPDQDVTVTVNFYEPLMSKLRLSDLIEYSAPRTDNDLKKAVEDTVSAPHTYPVWRKTFTTQENSAADDWATTAAQNRGLFLMTQGAARPHNTDPELEGQKFVPSEDQYIVVIDEEFDLSQVEIKLRQVVYHEDYLGTDDTHADGYNEDITVNVTMEVYPYEVIENWGQTGYGPTLVYTPAGSGTTIGYGTRPGNTATPTTHVTAQFAEKGLAGETDIVSAAQALSPKPGESTYVRITLSAADENNTTQSRYYYLEIHRRTKDPHVELNYGNSPYGMIWNNSAWATDAARTAAEKAFRDAGYTFRGADPSVTPKKVTDHGLDKVTYWREAWVRNRGLFEPESFTGANDLATPPWVDTTVYIPAENLDLDKYAYFAILGEDMREPGVLRAWDSSGRAVDVNTISAEVEVTLLDADVTTQVGRFSGTDTATIDLGTANGKRILTFLAEHQTTPALTVTGDNWPVSSTTLIAPSVGGGELVTTTTYNLIENIRPGRYLLQYTYTDFDGVSKLNYYRPFVILRGVGDVNTDGVRTNDHKTPGTDEYAIEDRVTDPLGYEAGEWDVPTASETVYPHANIFKYRVCDVNNDRNINNIDANLVDKNVRAEQANGSDLWLRFYEPVDYGLPDITP